MVDRSKLEFRHSFTTPANDGSVQDMTIIKYREHLPDGTTRPFVEYVHNMKRDYYLTKKEHQNHKDKKEFESIDKLNRFECIETDLVSSVFKQLNGYRPKVDRSDPKKKPRLSMVNDSPYVYGTDVSLSSILRDKYNKANPELKSEASIAVYDYETSMFDDEGSILMGSLTMKEKVFLCYVQSFVPGTTQEQLDANIQRLAKKHLLSDPDVAKRNIKIETMIVNTPGALTKEIFRRAHAWQPDYLLAFNMMFEINKSLNALKADGIDPAFIFSDPKVPGVFKQFTKTEKQPRKGEKQCDLWHSVYTPASFVLADPMTAYRRVRLAKQYLNSYSFDNITRLTINKGKLRVGVDEGNLSQAEWHRLMQTKHPFEYGIYCIFDCIGCELVDEKTKDISKTITKFADNSDHHNLASQPKMINDDLHFFHLERGAVVGSTSGNMSNSLDDLTPTKRQWIVTLASELIYNMANQIFEDLPDIRARVIFHSRDIDIKSAYPYGGFVGNMSKETTRIEVCGVEDSTKETLAYPDDSDLDDLRVRRLGLNTASIDSGSASIARFCYDYPTDDELLKEFEEAS